MKPKLVEIAIMVFAEFTQFQTGISFAAQNSVVADAPLVIEAASIKPSDLATCKEYPIIDGHGERYDLSCVKVKFLIQIAYGVRDFQILGSPAWIGSNLFNIAVRTGPASGGSKGPEKDVNELTDSERQASGARLRAMLQRLLADRFQLKIHHETKELPVYLLTVAKGGSKLKDGEKSSDVSGGLTPGRGFLAGSQTSISFLAQTLSQIVGRPILNRTGLIGKYDFELKWNPDQSSANSPLGEALPSLSPVDPNRPNIFTAIQEQLGLKLDSSKGPVEVIVVDHIEKASAN
jgi:bla regulator protein blaR1